LIAKAEILGARSLVVHTSLGWGVRQCTFWLGMAHKNLKYNKNKKSNIKESSKKEEGK